MDINEDYQMTKAIGHYMCRPLVQENDQLKARVAELETLVDEFIALGSATIGFDSSSDHKRLCVDVQKVMSNPSPAQSLKRHDAEVLKEFGDEVYSQQGVKGKQNLNAHIRRRVGMCAKT